MQKKIQNNKIWNNLQNMNKTTKCKHESTNNRTKIIKHK